MDREWANGQFYGVKRGRQAETTSSIKDNRRCDGPTPTGVLATHDCLHLASQPALDYFAYPSCLVPQFLTFASRSGLKQVWVWVGEKASKWKGWSSDKTRLGKLSRAAVKFPALLPPHRLAKTRQPSLHFTIRGVSARPDPAILPFIGPTGPRCS